MVEHGAESEDHCLRLPRFAGCISERPVVRVVIERRLLDVVGVFVWIQNEDWTCIYDRAGGNVTTCDDGATFALSQSWRKDVKVGKRVLRLKVPFGEFEIK